MDNLQVVQVHVARLVTLVAGLNHVFGLELDNSEGVSLVLRLAPYFLALIVPLPAEPRFRLHEVRVFPRERRHRRLIPLPVVPLLEDDAGLPHRQARLSGHRPPNELLIRMCPDLREVELV